MLYKIPLNTFTALKTEIALIKPTLQTRST